MGDDITIGVTEIVNNIEVTAQPNDQIVDISVTDNADNVTLNITPTVVEVNINKGSSFAQWGDLYGTLSDQTDLQNALNLKANLVDGKVPASELPSYVDDIIEVANYAALPTTGEIGKIYVTLDNNKIYRWSGSIYIEIASNSAIWGAITGTLSSQTDLQNALNAKQNTITLTTTGTTGAATLVGSTLNIPNYTTDISGLVPYTGATTNVDLGSHKLTASDLVINHSSGSGVAASITKGGNGEALTVVKSSGTGNAASITGGTTLISELHLTTDLADDYIASAAAWNAKQSALNGTGFVKISGTTISYDNSTYALDNAVVHLTGNETISGVKTLQNTLNLTSGVNIDDAYGFYWKTNVGEIETALAGIGQSSSGLNFFTGSSFISPRMVINSSGNVGIGTTTPTSAKLQVKGDNGTAIGYFFNNTGTAGQVLGLAVEAGTNSSDYALSVASSLGTPYLRVRGDGNVGIGTTSPSGLLHLQGNTTNPVTQVIDNLNAGTSAGTKISFRYQGTETGYIYNRFNGGDFNTDIGSSDYMRFLTDGSERMRITSGGSVGIGTPSPQSKLSVSTTGNNIGVSIGDSGNTSGKNLDLGYFITADYGYIQAIHNGVAFKNIAINPNGGNVGIGTTSPSTLFHIYKASFPILTIQSSSYQSSLGIDTTSGNLVLNNESNAPLSFNTNATERMRITSGGNVGIGTPSPAAKLTVNADANSNANAITIYSNNTTAQSYTSIGSYYANGNTNVNSQIRFGNENTNGGEAYLALATGSGSATERMRITSGGNVGIGTTSPISYSGYNTLTINGSTGGVLAIRNASNIGLNLYSTAAGGHISAIDATKALIFETADIERMRIASNGAITATSTITASGGFFNSDMRLKDLIDYNYNVSNIKPITYLWKDGRDNKKHVGYSAQEVQKVMPDAVNEDEKGFLSVNYVEVLVAKMEAMEKEIAYLKSKI